MNRMLVVSTCKSSCTRCFLPPCGSTDCPIVPSTISKAPAAPPRPTSPAAVGVFRLAADLVDLVDVHDAALRALDVVVGRLQELQDDVLDVLADVAASVKVVASAMVNGTSSVRAASAPKASCSRSARSAGCSCSAARRRCPWRRAPGAVVVVHRHSRAPAPLLADHVVVQNPLDLRGGRHAGS